MIQSQLKLPVQQVLRHFKYKIIDARGKEIIKDIDNLADSLFIEEACNNIGTAIKIIKQAKINLVTLIHLTPTGQDRNNLTDEMIKLESFLNTITNGE